MRIFIFLLLTSFYLTLTHANEIPPQWDFQGKQLLIMSDADMLASAYEDGKLGPRVGNDKLSIISLDAKPENYRAIDIDATNSVAGPPEVFDVTPDGNFVFIIETFSARPNKNDQETFKDLSLGTRLTSIDISDPLNPTMHQQYQIKERPDSISINHDGSLLAITYHNKGNGGETPLGIYQVKNGKVTSSHFPSLKNITKDDRLISAQWHPSRNILALVNNTKASVSLIEVSLAENNVSTQLWGNEVSVGKSPFIARFSQDGKHLLVNNLYWGPDVEGQWTEAPKGTIVNITLNHFTKNNSPIHSLTSQVMVGPSPEGFALSPDDRLVAAINMERSWLPYSDPRQTWFSSISLIERDPETGVMNHLHTTPYYAVLPEMAVFDSSSQYLAVVAFDQFIHNEKEGSVDFFKIVYDPLDSKRKMLVQTPYSVPVQRGAHDIILVE
jgi:hypothetical protein